MALTPLRNPSAGPRTVFVRRHRGMKKEERERVALWMLVL